MRTIKLSLKLGAALLVAQAAVTGCRSTDDAHASDGVYYGTGLNSPWYYGEYNYAPEVIVTPPVTQDRPVPASPEAIPSIPQSRGAPAAERR